MKRVEGIFINNTTYFKINYNKIDKWMDICVNMDMFVVNNWLSVYTNIEGKTK